MKSSQVEHVIRAASKICDDHEFFIFGSQSLHGKHPDVADDILASQEVDIFAKNRRDNSDYLNVIGIDSPFHETYGYYADPVDEHTAILPKGWKNRVSNLKMSNATSGVKAYCLDPHDLVVAKLAAAREKDRIFIRELIFRKLVEPPIIRRRIGAAPVPADRKAMMEGLLARLVTECEYLSGPSP
jgi:hypothetical protein